MYFFDLKEKPMVPGRFQMRTVPIPGKLWLQTGTARISQGGFPVSSWMTKPGVDSTVGATSWPQTKAKPQPQWEGPKHVHSYGPKYHV